MRGGKWLLGLGAFVVSVALGEGLLSLIYPQVYRRPPKIWQFDAELGWAHVPGGRGRLVTPEFSVEIAINSAGLRDSEYAQAKEPGVRRILLFGDSFAEGWGVESADALSSRLQSCLRQGGERVEVLNFGVAGYGTDQAYLAFQKLGKRFQPDLVIALFYGNDLWNNASPRGIGAEQGYKPYFRPQRDGRLLLQGVPVRKTRYWDADRHKNAPYVERARQYLRTHWHLYALVEKALKPEMPAAQQTKFYDGLYGVDAAGKWQPVWDLTGFILRDFAESVRKTDADFLLVYAPSIVQIEEQNWVDKRALHGLDGAYDLKKPNRQLDALSRRYGLTMIDLYDDFKRASAGRDLYLRDSHWNEEGHLLAAQSLCGFLQSPEVNRP